MPTLAELLQPRRGTLGVLQQQAVAQRPEPVGVLGSAGLDTAAKYGRALQQVGKNYASSLADMFTAPRRAYEGGYDVDESGNITPKFNAPVEANNFAMGLLGMNLPVPNPGGASLGMINAWHGSPHNIPMGRSMLMEKIGTGEGAQAYGHGLYAAESKNVAEFYRPKQSAFAPVQASNAQKSVESWLTEQSKPPKEFKKDISNIRKIDGVNNPDAWDAAYNALVEKAGGFKLGNMYKLELSHPDPLKEAATPLSPNDFLHWDLPLSQQPKGVIDALHKSGVVDFEKNIGPTSAGGIRELGWTKNVSNMSGEELYRKLTENNFSNDMFLGGKPKSEAASVVTKKLFDSGIPGIRYLDGGSRGAGQGTYNYVLFSPELANIVAKE